MDILSPFGTLSALWQRIPRHIKIQFFSALIMGLFVHLYIMTNGFVNHDSYMINSYDKIWYDMLGRWFGAIVDNVTTTFVLVWINRLLGLVYIGISACLIGSILGIRRTPLVLLLSGVMVSFPAIACAFTYVNTADGFFAVVFLVTLAFFIARRFKYGFLIGIIPMTLSMASYQAYIGFFSGLMIAVLIHDLLVNKEEAKAIFFKGVKYLITFAGGIVCYVASLRTPLVGVLSGYADVSEMGGLSLSNFLPRLVDSYTNLANFFFADSYHMHANWMWIVNYKYLFAAAFLLVAFLIIYIVIKRKVYKNKFSLILLALMLILFPPAVNLVAIASPNHLYIAMQYSIIIVFALALAVIEIVADIAVNLSCRWQKRGVGLSVWALLVIFCLTTLNYTLYTNTFYWQLEIMNKQGYAYSVSLMNRIQSDVDYKREKIILLFGSPPPTYSMQQFKSVSGIDILGGFIPLWYSYAGYLYNHVGLENTILDINSLQWYEFYELEEPEFEEFLAEMPSYPAHGSISEYQGEIETFIVVKFSDVDLDFD